MSWKWRRPQNTEDVLKAAVLANFRQAEQMGIVDDMIAQMRAAGFGEACELYERDVLRRQGVTTCMECGDDPNLPCRTCGTDHLPQAGWYEDPEHDGYLRWFNGVEWIGGPTLPKHALHTDDPETAEEDGYTQWLPAQRQCDCDCGCATGNPGECVHCESGQHAWVAA